MYSTRDIKRNTLSIHDKKSGSSYLVDTGADVSVYPAAKNECKSSMLSTPLVAANGTSIKSWGTKKLTLNLGQKREYQHEFQIADVTRPILGADFFIRHNILIDLKVDAFCLPVTGFSICKRHQYLLHWQVCLSPLQHPRTQRSCKSFLSFLFPDSTVQSTNTALNIISSQMVHPLMQEPNVLTMKNLQ